MSGANFSIPTQFKVGDKVFINLKWPEEKGPCHIRTPAYLRGHVGRIVRHFGAFPNPEKLAFAEPAELVNLYHVAVSFNELWEKGEAQHANLLVEVYENWMEKLND